MKNSLKGLICAVNLLFYTFCFLYVSVGKASAIDELTISFTNVGNVPTKLASQAVIYFDGYLYSLGGANDLLNNKSYLSKNENNSFSTWNETLNLPDYRLWHSFSNKNNSVYILGGNEGLSMQITNSVFKGTINTSHQIESWTPLYNLPIPTAYGASTIVGDYLYSFGGEGARGVQYDNVYYAKINTDGSLGSWIGTSPLPVISTGITAVNEGEYIYVLGRRQGAQVFVTKVNPDGSLQPWTYAPSLIKEAYRASITKVGNSIFVIGGMDYSGYPNRDIQYATILPDGGLSSWTRILNGFPRAQCCSPALDVDGRLVVTGGHDGYVYFSDVWSSNQLAIPTITPTPLPTATPTPTPEVLVTKTILVPGFGGSWNRDALLNCKNNDYEGKWELSPLADKVYEPFIQAMHLNRKYIYPYYYDWRQDVRDASKGLEAFIRDLTESGEKVDIVGHSFGGLVSREYVDRTYGAKVRKLMLVGTPNQGVMRAYPAWSGAEMMSPNPILNVAQSLVLQSCGAGINNRREVLRTNFPSIQNFLPTRPYIRDWLTDQLKPIENMEATNNWLPQGFSSPLNGVEIGTLAGTGKKTITEYKVRKQSQIDKLLNIWVDGKPISDKTSTEGDDTVLVTSAQIEGEDNRVVKDTHWGVISGKKSIDEILKFLGASPLLTNKTASVEEMTSALVVTSIDSDISVIDQKGKKFESKNGLLVIPNPKKANFKLILAGNGTNRRVSVGQFFADGKNLWKDYNFSNSGEWRGLLNFDNLNPREDVLK